MRIRNGMKAYAALQRLKSGDRSPDAKAEFDRLKDDLGYGLLLKKYTRRTSWTRRPSRSSAAVNDTIPERRPDLLVVSHHGRSRPLVPVRVQRGVLSCSRGASLAATAG